MNTKTVSIFLLKTFCLSAVCLFLFTFVVRVKRAEGNDMFPAVRDGDLCIFLRPGTAALQDIVLYRDPDGKQRIGRIAAQRGQTVDFSENGGYTVDEYIPAEEIPYETRKAEDADIPYPLQLGDNQLFLLNDFRSLTDDSRSFGAVETEQVQGHLVFLFRRRGF